MTQVVIDLPSSLVDLPETERDALLRAALFEAINARIRDLQRQLAEAHSQVAHFERRLGRTSAQLEAAGLPAGASPADHDAYLDWVYWQAVADEKAELLAALSA